MHDRLWRARCPERMPPNCIATMLSVGTTASQCTALGGWLSAAKLVELVCLHLRGLTFELSERQRWDARPGLWKMRHATDRAWWLAVGAPLERGVRPDTTGHSSSVQSLRA